MALPSSGQITFNQVNVELDNTATAQIGLNDSDVRGLFGKSSGQISMSDGYGKSSDILPTQTYQAAGYSGALANSSATKSLTFSGWSPQSGDLVCVAAFDYAFPGFQAPANFVTVSRSNGAVWAGGGYPFRDSFSGHYRICDGNESNSLVVVRGGAQTFGYNASCNVVGVVFRYANAITAVSAINTSIDHPIEPSSSSNQQRTINNSSRAGPVIVWGDSGAYYAVSSANPPSSYFSSLTNAFIANRMDAGGRSVFRPSNGSESVVWYSLPGGGSTGAGNEVRVSRFTTTLALSF